MTSQVKALETRFDGYRFRSRLEARWAVFFKQLGIDYGYEIEGYDLDGPWYLPDFYIPSLDCWIEIKPKKPTDAETDKARRLAEATRKSAYIFFGDIGTCFESAAHGGLAWGPNETAHALVYRDEDGGGTYWDCYFTWCQCPRCRHLSIQFEARAERGCACVQGDKGYEPFSPALEAAYAAARSYRFSKGIA